MSTTMEIPAWAKGIEFEQDGAEDAKKETAFEKWDRARTLMLESLSISVPITNVAWDIFKSSAINNPNCAFP